MDDVVIASGRALNGLLAGTYVAFTVAVMPALHDQPDDVFVRVMNRINVVIVRPAFLVLFIGAPAIAVAAFVSHRSQVTAGALFSAALALLITCIANVPLNSALATERPGARSRRGGGAGMHVGRSPLSRRSCCSAYRVPKAAHDRRTAAPCQGVRPMKASSRVCASASSATTVRGP